MQPTPAYSQTSDGKSWFVIVCCNHFLAGNKVWLLPGQYPPWRCLWVTSLLFCCSNIWLRYNGFHMWSTADPYQVTVLFLFYWFFFFFFNLILYLFSFPQVAQWPEKEEKEQPMFGEEYDWWVNGSSFSPHIGTEELFSWFVPFINRWQTFLFCFGFFGFF